jgi:outer membrane lipoprotein-sorting protein
VKRVRVMWIWLAGVFLAGTVAAADLDARQIMERNFFATKVGALQVESTMVLINNRGQTRERKNTTLFKLQPNGIDSKFLVRFSSPADIKGTGFLQVEHSDADDDLWIYLPALKKSRRLVANNKKDSFVGSDFSYGDISLPKVDLYKHTLLRTERVGEFDCYVVESIPANDQVKANSGYSREITWARKDNFIEAKVEYYDLGGRLLKTQLTKRHELMEPEKNRWFVLYREMMNHQTGHRTTFNGDKFDPKPSAPDELFTTRSIERE